jgi:hypothetical protein
VPALVVSVSLAARRWGPKIAGLLTGLPIVTGPALFFFAVEQGDAFAAEAARAVLVSLVGVELSGVAYAWAALRAPWWASLLASWTVFFASVLVVQRAGWSANVALVAACVGLLVSQFSLPRGGATATGPRPAWDLPFRVFAAMLLVVSVTSLAHRLGPTLSGALTPFPVAVSTLLAFSHAQGGSAAAISFLRGFMPGMWAFTAFCYVLSIGIVPLGSPLGFAVALACTLAIQGTVLWGMQSATMGR